MNKSQKLFESIGRLDDRDLAEALDYKEERPAKPRARFSVIMAAAVVAVGLMLMAFTYGDEILNAIFKRQTELVDDKIGHIDESVTVGNITLTMDSVTVDSAYDKEGAFSGSFIGSYTVSFHIEDGVFEGGLNYGGYKLEALVNAEDGQGAECEWVAISGDNINTIGIFDYPLKVINYGCDNPTDTITLSSMNSLGYYSDCRLTFYNLTSVDSSVKYADELSVEFNVSEDMAKPLQLYWDFDPHITFEIEGVTFELISMKIYPDKMHICFVNSNADCVNIAGVDCYAISYFTKLPNTDEYYEKAAIPGYNQPDIFTPTEDESFLNGCYEMLVEIKPECGAEITAMRSGYGGFQGTVVGATPTPSGSLAEMFASFSSPIYLDDIVRVYARKIGDPSVEVNIWVPAEDESLESYLN